VHRRPVFAVAFDVTSGTMGAIRQAEARPSVADSMNNPYGAGSPFKPDSPNNPYGKGCRIEGR
jgi:hypothetical protein